MSFLIEFMVHITLSVKKTIKYAENVYTLLGKKNRNIVCNFGRLLKVGPRKSQVIKLWWFLQEH